MCALVGDESSRTATDGCAGCVTYRGANAAPRVHFANSENHFAVELQREKSCSESTKEKFLPITAVTFRVSKVHMNKPHGS